MRRLLRDQRGFSLAELMIAVAIIGVVMAGVFVLQRQAQQAYLLGSNRVETQQNARVAVDLMTRELRSAQSVTTLTSATDMTFVDQNGDTIRYALSSGTLNRTVNGVTTALIGGVQSLAMTYYSVYDVYTATYTTTTAPSAVRVVKIYVLTKTEESTATGMAADQHAVMESTVKLRASLL
jgi:prepilin-type N-terminal cleavage/methylation domain-containing protein